MRQVNDHLITLFGPNQREKVFVKYLNSVNNLTQFTIIFKLIFRGELFHTFTFHYN